MPNFLDDTGWPASESAKAKKDVNQAVNVLDVLSEIRPFDIEAAMSAVSRMPDKFKKQLASGVRMAGVKI
jgi:hypothetical protein